MTGPNPLDRAMTPSAMPWYFPRSFNDTMSDTLTHRYVSQCIEARQVSLAHMMRTIVMMAAKTGRSVSI